MQQHNVKLRYTKATTPEAIGRLKEVFWMRLRKCEPFLRGALNTGGPKRGGKRKAISLVYRKGDSIRSTYIPVARLKEVKQKAVNYREAKNLLAKIADCELRLFKLSLPNQRAEKRK